MVLLKGLTRTFNAGAWRSKGEGEEDGVEVLNSLHGLTWRGVPRSASKAGVRAAVGEAKSANGLRGVLGVLRVLADLGVDGDLDTFSTRGVDGLASPRSKLSAVGDTGLASRDSSLNFLSERPERELVEPLLNKERVRDPRRKGGLSSTRARSRAWLRANSSSEVSGGDFGEEESTSWHVKSSSKFGAARRKAAPLSQGSGETWGEMGDEVNEACGGDTTGRVERAPKSRSC